jgi:hypothetical protein
MNVALRMGWVTRQEYMERLYVQDASLYSKVAALLTPDEFIDGYNVPMARSGRPIVARDRDRGKRQATLYEYFAKRPRHD